MFSKHHTSWCLEKEVTCKLKKCIHCQKCSPGAGRERGGKYPNLSSPHFQSLAGTSHWWEAGPTSWARTDQVIVVVGRGEQTQMEVNQNSPPFPLSIHFCSSLNEETLTPNMWETPLATVSHRMSIQLCSEQDLNCNVNYLQNLIWGSRKGGEDKERNQLA